MVAGKLLVVVVLYLVTIYVVFGVALYAALVTPDHNRRGGSYVLRVTCALTSSSWVVS